MFARGVTMIFTAALAMLMVCQASATLDGKATGAASVQSAEESLVLEEQNEGAAEWNNVDEQKSKVTRRVSEMIDGIRRLQYVFSVQFLMRILHCGFVVVGRSVRA